MEEINLYHLVKEHPLISFLVLAIPVVLLTFIIATRIMSYREERRERQKGENK